MELTKLKGVGPKTAEKLIHAGIAAVEDLPAIPPRRYVDRRRISPIADSKENDFVTVCAEVQSVSFRSGFAGRKAFASVKIADESGAMHAYFFGHPAKGARSLFFKGRRVLMGGAVKIVKDKTVLQHPEYSFPEDGDDGLESLKEIRPIYPNVRGFSQKQLRAFIQAACALVGDRLIDALPADEFGLDFPSLRESLQSIHYPAIDGDIDQLNENNAPGQRRMVFDELFFLQLGLRIRRDSFSRKMAPAAKAETGFMEKAIRRAAGFTLTADQETALAQIVEDLRAKRPMHRLLQGDVGSGKTIVALLAAARVAESGYQSALMAPTEVLALQHYRTIKPLAEKAGMRTGLLTGGIPAADADEICRRAQEGAVDLLIGTHALIGKRVEFLKLGLAIIDEQHRFGVLQRAKLRAKQTHPHVLVMSATPIPRTMAMTVFGDLDHSVIRSKPPGRLPVETKLLFGDTQEAYRIIADRVRQGEQAYIVYPLVAESDDPATRDATTMYKKLAGKHFPNFKVGLLHGRMKEKEKSEILGNFMDRKLDILVSTTVIEVGVDAPAATAMLIENAERFGLSQLHQLRGRIGRSDKPGICILSASGDIGEKAMRRLQALLDISDGFLIAEKDMDIRGPGDILGRRQHGLPVFRWASLARDMDMLHRARQAACDLLKSDPGLIKHPNIIRVLRHRWRSRMEFETIG